MFIFTTQGGKKEYFFFGRGEGCGARREGSVFARLCGVCGTAVLEGHKVSLVSVWPMKPHTDCSSFLPLFFPT